MHEFFFFSSIMVNRGEGIGKVRSGGNRHTVYIAGKKEDDFSYVIYVMKLYLCMKNEGTSFLSKTALLLKTEER